MKSPRIIIYGLLFLLLVAVALGDQFTPVVLLALGWIPASARIIDQVKSWWPLLWWSAGFLGAVLLLLWFCKGLTGKRAMLRPIAALSTIALCVLLAGMCLAGSVHQVAWLASSKEPWYWYSSSWSHLDRAAHAAASILKDSSNPERWTEMWLQTEWEKGAPQARRSLHEIYATHLRTDASGRIAEIILWPRDGSDFRENGGKVITRDGEYDEYKRADLLEYLRLRPEELDAH